MAHILSIETATGVCSVALHDAGKLLAKESLAIERSHSRHLNACIAHMLEVTGIDKKDLHAVAVSKGPGSYTGLRIGTSAAKGLCYALDLPLIGVNTLEAMARIAMPYVGDDDLLCPMIDARRMEVYCLVLSRSGRLVAPTEAKIIDGDSFADLLVGQRVFFFGDGSHKCRPLLDASPNAVFVEGVLTDAMGVGELAWQQFEAGRFEDLAYFEPYYLKDFMTRKPAKK